MIRYLYIGLGCLFFGIGTLGIFVPVLPTTIFYLATLYFFAKSSKRLHDWFVASNFYKKHLKSFVEKRGMLLKTKISAIITLTLTMGLGIFFMARKSIWIPCIILAIVWIGHVVYFLFFVKTIASSQEENKDLANKE